MNTKLNYTLTLMTEFIPDEWKELLLGRGKEEILRPILDQLDHKKIVPEFKDIFNFTKYTNVKDIRVIILGQDPYPNLGDAHGLAFSYLGKSMPMSLRRIFGALKNTGLITDIPAGGNLQNWAKQGILLLNSALTTELCIPGKHLKMWEPWTRSIIKELSYESKKQLIWVFWGKPAQKFASSVNVDKDKILSWCHPTASENPSFSECTNFVEIAEIYPDIVWTTIPHDTHWFTDGSCKGNQSRSINTRAAWGVVCKQGALEGYAFGGPVKTKKIGGEIVYPSNIRAEGLAILNCIRTIWKIGLGGVHTIHTDSKFWIDMESKYIPSWESKGIPFTEKKNPDIVTQLAELVKKFKAEPGWTLVLKYVKAWHDYTPTADQKYIHGGNREAEKTAENCLPNL